MSITSELIPDVDIVELITLFMDVMLFTVSGINAFSGTSFVEITGGSYGFVPDHTFTWLGQYGVTMPVATNYITATRRIIRSTIYTPGVNSDAIDIRTVGYQ